MANRIPGYFLTPTNDLPPPLSGPLRLGSILSSVKTPARPLYSPPAPTADDVFSSEQRRFEFSTDQLRARKFGLFTRFLSVVLGIGVDAVVGWETMCVEFFTSYNI